MRKKLNHMERELEKSAKKPGPGFYQQANLTGSGLNSSVMRNSTKSSIPKSEDRFKMNKWL